MIEESVLLNAGRNICILNELAGIVTSFADNGIKAICLKGITIAETLYPNIGMREVSDIDLLIRPKDVSVANQRLIELGFRPGNCALTFTKNTGVCIEIDMHTGIPYLTENEIWDEASHVKINGVNIRTLSLEQNLIFLCYHLAVGHGFAQKKWLEDIHRLINYNKDAVLWATVIEKIEAYGLGIPCYWCLLKVKEVFNSPIPDFVFSRLKPKDSIKSKIFKIVIFSSKPLPFIDYLLGVLINSPRYLLNRAFPSVEFLESRYNIKPPFCYICYLFRPFFLLFKLIEGFFALVLR